MSRERVLIAGCGALGKRVGARLVAARAHVTGTSRRQEGLRNIEALGLASMELDVTRLPESLGAFERVLFAMAPRRDEDAEPVYAEGPLAVLRALDPAALRCFVLVSSTGVYAQSAGEAIDEDSPAEPDPATRAGAIRRGERALLAEAPRAPVSVLRLGGLYGSDRSPVEWLRRPGFTERMRGVSARGFMNWIHIDDAVEAALAALERAEPGRIYNAVDGAPIPRAEFWRLAASLAGVDPPELDADSEDRGKRIDNRRLRDELGVRLRYPDARSGLAALEGAG